MLPLVGFAAVAPVLILVGVAIAVTDSQGFFAWDHLGYEAIGRSIAANASVVRVEGGAEPDGRLNVTVHTTGTPLADATCTGDVRIVVRRAMGPAILDEERHFDQPCGWDSNGRTILYDACVAWALERSVDALSRPE